MLSVETDCCHKRAAELAEGATTGGSSQKAQCFPRGPASLVTREPAAELGPRLPTSNEVAGQVSDGRARFNSVGQRAALATAVETVLPPSVGNKLAVPPIGVAAAAGAELVSDDGVSLKRWPSSPPSPAGLAESYGASARSVFGSVGSTTSTDSASTVFSAIIEGRELDFPQRSHRSASSCLLVPDDYAQHSGASVGLVHGVSGSRGGIKPVKNEFDGLPAEIKVRVFMYLKAEDLIIVSRVSRSWNTLAYDGALWSRVDVQAFYSKIPKDKIEHLFSSAGEFLRAANLRGCSQITSSTLRRMADACPNLAELDLEGCSSASSRGLAHAVSKLRKLRRFHAAGLVAVTDDVLEQLAVAATTGTEPPPLESLIIARCRKVTAVGIMRVVSASPNLSTLSIGGCGGLDDAALEAIGSSNCAARLRQLSLAWCVSITDAGIVKLVSRAVPLADPEPAPPPPPADRPGMSLESLDLTGCVQVGDAGVSAVCSASPGLRFLDLEDCRLVTDASLRALANSNPRLEVLSLAHCEGVRDEGVSLVLAACNLRRLSLDCCPMVTSATLRRVVELARHCAAPAPGIPATAGFAASPATAAAASAPILFRLRELEVNDCIAVSSSSVSEAISEVPSLQVKCFYTWQARAEEESRRTRSAADATVSVASSDDGSGGDSSIQGSHGRRHVICNIL